MKRTIISTILVLLLCCGLAVSVSAESGNINFVYDELGYLTQEESTALSGVAWEIYQETGVGVFFNYVIAEDIENGNVTHIAKGITDYVIMMENETHWCVYLGGRCESIDQKAKEHLRGIYDETETYYEGVEAFMYAVADYFPAVEAMSAGDTDAQTLVYDDAGLLSEDEVFALNEKLLRISKTYNAQIVITTIPSMDGGDVDEFVESLYDTMGFGYGENRDGVLLLVSMDPREYRILSNGFAADAITMDDIDAIGDAIVSDLSDGDYRAAFDGFADECEYYLDGHINGFPFRFGRNLLICLIIGIAAGAIVAGILKGQLKSVRKQDRANVYVKPGSMQLTTSRDLFLYSSVTRTKRESDSSKSSSGGGGSRNVGGGSF